MAGTVMRPTVSLGGTAVDMSNPQILSPSYVNSFRISAVTSRLLAHLQGETNTDISEFCNLCLSLARGIDYAVSNNDIPDRAPDLPYILKQVCQRRNDLQSQAAIMVLMISVKSACTNGWFSEKAKEELHALSDDMQSSFCSVSVKDINSDMKNKEKEYQPTISMIMSRFYPGMKMGEILSFVESKTGYDSYVTDLHISKRARTSDDKIYLFVAQIENTETSTCIISPQQVNFLLNGEGVERRTCVYKDPGPQMPTPVTHMLKYGSNLLQVVGQFNGRYVIVIAFMSVVTKNFHSIPDYISPVAAPHDSDNEIVEGPSRISLKCPISFSRIKTPVKGHSCKHLQCFDFNNYVGINSRRPLWRCPHCSQSVCFLDIRIDQSMVKVLKEVGENVTYVKISSDGSWETVAETNENTEKTNGASPSHQETNNQDPDDIMDLTGNDNESYKDDDQKPCPSGEPSVVNKTAPHMEDGFWKEFYSSDLPSRTANSRSHINDIVQRNHQMFNSLTQNQSQSQIPVSNNEHVRSTPFGWVVRSQTAIQALPAQSSAMVVDGDRQQQNFSRSNLNQHQVQRMNSFPSSQHTSSHGQRDHLPHLNQTSLQPGSRSASPQQINFGRHASPQQINGGRHTSPLTENRFQSHQHQSMNQRTPIRPSHQFRHAGMGPMTNLSSSHSQYSLSAIHRTTHQQMSPSIPPPVQTFASSVTVASLGDQRDVSSEENWRPTGRMRGSLSGGREYTEGLNIIRPNQPVQAARPPQLLNTPRPFIPPHFQALMANNARPQTPQAGQGTDAAGGLTEN